VNHQKGKSLNIKSNICGGLELDVNHTPNNLGGRTINVLATKAGAQMFKYHGDTSMVNDAAMLKVGLRGEFDLGPKIILYKTIVSKYRILTPFAKRSGIVIVVLLCYCVNVWAMIGWIRLWRRLLKSFRSDF